MPKMLTGVNNGVHVGKAQIPSPGEPRNTSNSLEAPLQALLNDLAHLNARVSLFLETIGDHEHDAVSLQRAGFMTPALLQALGDLENAFPTHGHAIATVNKPGFMSGPQVDKLNKVEIDAEKVTRARIEAALDIRYGQFTIPESTFSAGQTKSYEFNHQGLRYDAPVTPSETYKSSAFLMTYHVEDNLITATIRNLNSTSRTFPGGTVHYRVDNGGAADRTEG